MELTQLDNSTLIQNAISLAEEPHPDMNFNEQSSYDKWHKDTLALIKVLKAIRDKNDWHGGSDISTSSLLTM